MKPEIIKKHFPNGRIYSIKYFLNGKYHREDGPAYIDYHNNGNINIEKYYFNDIYHREDGPALVSYFDDGDIFFQAYYINGIELTESEWLIQCRKRKLKSIL